MQLLLPEGVNTIGIVAVLAFFLCGIGAGVSALLFFRSGAVAGWSEPRFRRFFLFCLAGLLCAVVALAFGGWPTGYE